jgi:alginate O-acetyltransferase complex protein AlgI
VIAVYFLLPQPNGKPSLRNTWLLIASLVFYGWGEPKFLFLVIGETLFVWLLGLAIDRFRGKPLAKVSVVATIVGTIGSLALFKYADFFIESINAVFKSPIKAIGLALPIGISFFTFQILSYSIDLYRGNTAVQKNYFTLLLYVSLFPQLIAGPIVRYSDVAEEMHVRTHSLDEFAAGASRFVLGLGKKVLIANVLGELSSICKASDEHSLLMAWLYAIAYALHIYFDFSGYSDMAIGMGRMFGFHFLENFNYPYISKSITEFWRRWHMSLSSWFRDYVYIPLGGNRAKTGRHIFNIALVWLLTGFWHGAAWNFVIWGVMFAILLIVEKYLLASLLEKAPAIVGHVYTMLFVLISWMIFDSIHLGDSFRNVGHLFGIGIEEVAGQTSAYYLRSYILPLCVGIFGCTPIVKHLYGKFIKNMNFSRCMTVVQPVVVAALLFVITAFLVDGSFTPFIYFRF